MKIMVMTAVALLLAVAVPIAMADESSTDAAYLAVDQAQKLYAAEGANAFEMISTHQVEFDPFVFVFGVDDLVVVASSNYPELVGEARFDPSQAGYSHEDFTSHLEECDGLWFLNTFESEPGVVHDQVIWLSEAGGYVFSSGFFLPDLNLPEWLQAWYEEQLQVMVRLLNAAVGCECA